MRPTIRIAQRACEAAKARQAIVVWFDEHGQFAAGVLTPEVCPMGKLVLSSARPLGRRWCAREFSCGCEQFEAAPTKETP